VTHVVTTSARSRRRRFRCLSPIHSAPQAPSLALLIGLLEHLHWMSGSPVKACRIGNAGIEALDRDRPYTHEPNVGGDYITYDATCSTSRSGPSPLRTVAKSYGVSDVSSARSAASSPAAPGRAMAKVRREVPASTAPAQAEERRTEQWLLASHQESHKLWKSARSQGQPRRAIVVARAERAHKLVARTERRLRRAKPRYGSSRGLGEVLDVSVSPESLDVPAHLRRSSRASRPPAAVEYRPG